MKKRAANNLESEKSGNSGNEKKLKLNAEMKAAMGTLIGQTVAEAESDEEDF